MNLRLNLKYNKIVGKYKNSCKNSMFVLAKIAFKESGTKLENMRIYYDFFKSHAQEFEKN